MRQSWKVQLPKAPPSRQRGRGLQAWGLGGGWKGKGMSAGNVCCGVLSETLACPGVTAGRWRHAGRGAATGEEASYLRAAC